MRRANVEEPIMKNDSIAVELRRKGSRIWVVSHLQPNALESVENPKMTPCPTSTGRPIVVLPKILVAHTEASVHANVSCGSESMRRGDARQACAKLHIEIP